MTNSLNKYDIVIVKFPFASSLKYKARPAVVISSDMYHRDGRGTVIILAISSQVDKKLNFESNITQWKEAGLLKPSLLKATIATIEYDTVIQTLGKLSDKDRQSLDTLLKNIC